MLKFKANRWENRNIFPKTKYKYFTRQNKIIFSSLMDTSKLKTKSFNARQKQSFKYLHSDTVNYPTRIARVEPATPLLDK